MTQPHALTCPSCNAALTYDGLSETIRCDFCGSTLLMPESQQTGAPQSGIVGEEEPEAAAYIHEILHLVQQGKKIQAIKVYRQAFGRSLKEAKEAIDQLDHGQPTVVHVSPVVTATAATTTAATTGCSCLIPLLIILILGAVGFAFFFTENPGTLDRLSQALGEGDIEQIAAEVGSSVSAANRAAAGEALAVTSGGDGLLPDLLLETWQYGADISIALGYLQGMEGNYQIAWENPLGTTTSVNPYSTGFDERQVYISQGTSIRALDRDDGRFLWETVLSDSVNRNCTGCIRTAQNKVIVLTADNVLEAFDAASGRSVWQIRLQDESFAVPDAGQIPFALLDDQVAILDEGQAEEPAGSGLHFYSLEGGELNQVLQPICPDIEQFFDDETLDFSSQTIIDETSGDILFLFGSGLVRQLCLQRWDAHSGEIHWETRLPPEIRAASAVRGGLYAAGQPTPYTAVTPDSYMLTLANDQSQTGVVSFDRANGSTVFQHFAVDIDVAPVGQQDDTILLRAERTRGTDQVEIWGVDLTSGERRWQQQLSAEYLYELDPFSDRYSYRLLPDGLVILQLLTDSDPATLLVQKLAVDDGRQIYETETPILDANFWSGLTWTSREVFLVLRTLYVVDLEEGSATGLWP